jgi:hypothetical protein
MHKSEPKIFRNVEEFISRKYPLIVERLEKLKKSRMNFFFEQEESRLLSISPSKLVFMNDNLVRISNLIIN